MGFGQSGWFTALLEQELAQHQPLEDARAPGVSRNCPSVTTVSPADRPLSMTTSVPSAPII